jgi:hypothetical protein
MYKNFRFGISQSTIPSLLPLLLLLLLFLLLSFRFLLLLLPPLLSTRPFVVFLFRN